MGLIEKSSVANVVAGFAVVAGIIKGFIIDGQVGELEIMIIGTALGYLFGSAITAKRNGATTG